jgi:hypothetical protein
MSRKKEGKVLPKSFVANIGRDVAAVTRAALWAALLCSSGLIFEQAWMQIAPGRRALGGRAAVVVQGCKERKLACLCGAGGGQLRASQFENVLPAVKSAVDDNEGGRGS